MKNLVLILVHMLPGYIDQRYKDCARASASSGINETVLTNINANALILTKQYLLKVAALADVFRPYGIRLYRTARFSAPIEIGGSKTADLLDPTVKKWWQKKCDEIYSLMACPCRRLELINMRSLFIQKKLKMFYGKSICI